VSASLYSNSFSETEGRALEEAAERGKRLLEDDLAQPLGPGKRKKSERTAPGRHSDRVQADTQEEWDRCARSREAAVDMKLKPQANPFRSWLKGEEDWKAKVFSRCAKKRT